MIDDIFFKVSCIWLTHFGNSPPDYWQYDFIEHMRDAHWLYAAYQRVEPSFGTYIKCILVVNGVEKNVFLAVGSCRRFGSTSTTWSPPRRRDSYMDRPAARRAVATNLPGSLAMSNTCSAARATKRRLAAVVDGGSGA
eukprot:2571641-Pleurochrysis_carterae.AAC.1